MNNAIKLGRFSTQSSVFTNSSSITRSSKGIGGGVRFMQVKSSGSDPKQQHKVANMDDVNNKDDDHKDKNFNAMEESFGGGYSTRSDEEGFGGIYGRNDEDNAEMKIVQDPAHHESTQGSHVKEKEAARNQTKAH